MALLPAKSVQKEQKVSSKDQGSTRQYRNKNNSARAGFLSSAKPLPVPNFREEHTTSGDRSKGGSRGEEGCDDSELHGSVLGVALPHEKSNVLA
jgi:hypothetical protein